MDNQSLKNGVALYEAKKELHELMRKVIKSTKLGRRHSAYDDSLGLDIGGGELWSCFKFGQLEFSPIESKNEYDCDAHGINDLGMIQCLTKEIKKRYEFFQYGKKINKKQYLKGKKRFAKIIFVESIKSTINMYQ